MKIEKVFNNLALNDSCKQQHDDVIQKGFDNFHIPTLLMLTVSELGEALEADRKNKHANLIAFDRLLEKWQNDNITEEEKDAVYKTQFEHYIKDSFEDEIADAFLRLMDLCGAYRINIERHIQLKAKYNKLRPLKHGKEY